MNEKGMAQVKTTVSLAEVEELRNEVKLLRSFVVGLSGKDSEGNYRPEFVRRVLAAVSDNLVYTFKDRLSFIKHLKANGKNA